MYNYIRFLYYLGKAPSLDNDLYLFNFDYYKWPASLIILNSILLLKSYL